MTHDRGLSPPLPAMVVCAQSPRHFFVAPAVEIMCQGDSQSPSQGLNAREQTWAQQPPPASPVGRWTYGPYGSEQHHAAAAESEAVATLPAAGNPEGTRCCSAVQGQNSPTAWLCSGLRIGRKHEEPLEARFVDFVHAGNALVDVEVQGGFECPLRCICNPPSGRVVRAIRLATPAAHLDLGSYDRLDPGGGLAMATRDRMLLLPLGLCLDSGLHYFDEVRSATEVVLEGRPSFLPGLFSALHWRPVHSFVQISRSGA